MKKFGTFAAAVAAVLAVASPAMAQGGMVVITPGASQGGAQKQPTQFLGTEMAQVLSDNLGYVSVSGPGLNYHRGMGGGAELAFNLGLGLNVGATTAFSGAVGAGWKQQLSRTGGMAIAVNGNVGLTGIGSGALGVGAMAGLPISFGLGLGSLTVQPQVSFPSLTAGTGATTGATVGANVGLMTPIANNWQLLAAVTPNVGLGGGGFALPLGLGARFSPTATSHLDVTVGNLNVTPAFGGSLGLVGLTGHLGF